MELKNKNYNLLGWLFLGLTGISEYIFHSSGFALMFGILSACCWLVNFFFEPKKKEDDSSKEPFLELAKNTGRMPSWKIDNEKNIISISVQMQIGLSKTTSEFFPETKTFISSQVTNSNVKLFKNNIKRTYEYRISKSPASIEVGIKKDGIEEWKKMECDNSEMAGYAQLFFILSKHPEIISKVEYDDFLRKTEIRIAQGVAKISALVKEDKEGLQIISDANGAMIFPLERGETRSLQKLKLDYIEKTFFDKDSKEYSGISEKEYKIYKEILRHIDELEK
jgi:hypothetical protein